MNQLNVRLVIGPGCLKWKGMQMRLHGSLLVEIVLRKKQIPQIPEKFKGIIANYNQYESEDRLVLDVPTDWIGLRDNTVISMLKEFNESMYLALAYITDDPEEIVTDFLNNPVDKYDTIFNGKRCSKYVKKRLRIIRVMNREENVFSMWGFELDVKYPEPIVNVLEVYSGGLNSGVLLESFNKGGL